VSIPSFFVRSSRWVVAGVVPLLLGVAAPRLGAQPGVRLGLIYGEGGTRPGIFVLPVAGSAGDSIRSIVMRDLDFGDRVTVLPKTTALPTPASGAVPNYAAAARLGINGIVQLVPTAGGMTVILHDVGTKAVLQRKSVSLGGAMNSGSWRMAVHGISDDCEEWITGERGIAASRLAYVAEGRIWVIDSDGALPTPITGAGRVLSPGFHPNGQSVVYAALEPAGSAIYVSDLRGAARRVVPPSGLNISPTFTPNGASIAYSHGDDFGTELYVVPAAGGTPRRISIGRGSDNTSPTFSPDGRRIAFTSGRSGRPDVYIADEDGTNADVLAALSSASQAYRSSPDWSPDGRAIVFQSQLGGRFQAMLITLRDRVVRQLTSEGANEDPAWAPDARHVVVSSTRTGVRQLWVIDTETGRARQLTASGGSRLAAWSSRVAR
jgi:TolB protein